MNTLQTDIRRKILFILYFLAFFTFSKTLYAQDEEHIAAQVFYVLKHKQDTNKLDSTYTENMVLYLSQNVSLFTSLDQIEQKLKIGKSLDEQTKNWTGPGLPRFKSPSGLRKTSNQEVYQFQREKKIFVKEYLLRSYLYDEIYDEINWKLLPETKSFDKIRCQKATAKYKGRTWNVWFAQDIPFETGPWKLHGLPGLIIEATDSTNQVQFLFSGFESIKTNNHQQEYNSIGLPKNSIKVSATEIYKLKAAMYSNPKGFFNVQLQATRGILDSKDVEGLSFKKVNNPIDLTENK